MSLYPKLYLGLASNFTAVRSELPGTGWSLMAYKQPDPRAPWTAVGIPLVCNLVCA